MFWTLYKKELLENWRTHKLLVLGIVLVALGILSPAVAKFAPELVRLAAGQDESMEAIIGLVPEPTVLDSIAQYLENMSGMAMLVLVLLVMGLVAREKERGTAILVLARPVSRTVFLLSKLAAFVTLMVLGLAAAGLVCFLYTGLLFGEWLEAGVFLAVNVLLLLYLLAPVSLTFLGSTLWRSSFLAAGFGLLGLLVMGLLGSWRVLRDYMPGQLTGAAASLAHGNPFEAWPAVMVSLGLVVLGFVLASLAFQRQEL